MTDPRDHYLIMDHLKIMGYGESDTSGCWWKLQLTPEHLEAVRGRRGEMVEITARLIDEHGEYLPIGEHIPADKEPDPDKPYGKFWEAAMRNGTFKSKRLAATIGTQAEYVAWTRLQPSCISGGKDHIWGGKDRKCEFAHVRRAGGSGTGYKEDYSGVPLTHEEHTHQHNHGERSCLRKWHKNDTFSDSVEAAKEWFDQQAARNLEAWTSIALAKEIGAKKSRAEVVPWELIRWLENYELTELISKKMLELADSEP